MKKNRIKAKMLNMSDVEATLKANKYWAKRRTEIHVLKMSIG